MPRSERIKSKTGIYHVILRGINRQDIFNDEEDYETFIKILTRCKSTSGFILITYCLMSNHFHLLIKDENEDLSMIIKRIAGSYVYWYNHKYHRSGHLFQDRFKSETVEDDGNFLAIMRFIHRNPIKAGLCKEIGEYGFSSYNDIIDGKSNLVDTDYINLIIYKDEFIRFCNEKNNDICMDIDNTYRVSDADAKKMIKKVSGCENEAEFQGLEYERRGKCISELKENGLSIRQINRLTGISFALARKF